MAKLTSKNRAKVMLNEIIKFQNAEGNVAIMAWRYEFIFWVRDNKIKPFIFR